MTEAASKLLPGQVLALAPDPASASAGKKLARAALWQNLGAAGRVVWGEHRGSALYQVRADLTDFATKCSCPSRKFPCKHSLGLLLIAAASSPALPEKEPPAWVAEWASQRASRSEKKEKREAAKAAGEPSVDPVAQAKRAAERTARIEKGIEGLDRFLTDLVKNGLGGLEGQPPSFWEAQAARLVDAQAPGLATRVRRLGTLASGEDWPRRMLDQMGRLALLAEAFRKLPSLPPALAFDVRALVGFAMREEDVLAQGERVSDAWLVVGQVVDDDERVRVQRSWLVGRTSQRVAMVLQFAVGTARFAEAVLPGTEMIAEIAYYPSAAPDRALIASREGEPRPISGALPGERVTELLDRFARELAQQPFRERTGVVVTGVVPAVDAAGGAWLIDEGGVGLRLATADPWTLPALSGGAPIEVAGEWDGAQLTPLGAGAEGRFHALGGGAA